MFQTPEIILLRHFQKMFRSEFWWTASYDIAGFVNDDRTEEAIIIQPEKNGTYILLPAQHSREGGGQLWYPRKVAAVRKNSDMFVVCDRGYERE